MQERFTAKLELPGRFYRELEFMSNNESMKRCARLLLAAAALCLQSMPISAAESCIANVRVTNQNRAPIRVLTFSYRLSGSSEVHEEKLDNKTVASNATVNWPGQLLHEAAVGTLVSSTAVTYQIYANQDTGPVLGPVLKSPWFQSTISCGRGYDYVHYID